MSRARFKLQFRQIEIVKGLRKMRALIIAVAPIPGQSGWVQAVLALEDGNVIQKPITSLEFELSERTQVTLMEADGESAAPATLGLEAGKVG